jgi:transposase-like protein
VTIEKRYSHWQGIIEEQKTSGITIADYCRRHRIVSSVFYTWRCKIRQRQNGHGGFVELKPSRLHTGIRIYPGENMFIEVSRGFDPVTLHALLAVMGNR